MIAPEDAATDLSPDLDLRWNTVKDDDGDAVLYRVCIWASGTTPKFTDCQSIPVPHTPWTARLPRIPLLVILLILLVLLVLIARRNPKLALPALALAVLLMALAIVLLKQPETVPETNGNMVAAASERGLLVRVGKPGEAEALARPGAQRMVMNGRAMSGYVRVEPGALDARAVKGWLRLARAFVETLPAGKAGSKTTKRKRGKA